MAAAGLWTTPTDLAKFAIEIALSKQGKANHVLSEKMTNEMLTPVMDGAGLGFFLDKENPGQFGHNGADDAAALIARDLFDDAAAARRYASERPLPIVVKTDGLALGKGVTICNDVSSRSIEGENPLYLPQAKIYLGACALGPMVRPAWEVPDPYSLTIALTIRRGGSVAWQGTASTAQLHRRYDDLVSYLMRADVHPEGVVL